MSSNLDESLTSDLSELIHVAMGHFEVKFHIPKVCEIPSPNLAIGIYRTRGWLAQVDFDGLILHEETLLPERSVRCNASARSNHDDRGSRVLRHVEGMCLSDDARNSAP